MEMKTLKFILATSVLSASVLTVAGFSGAFADDGFFDGEERDTETYEFSFCAIGDIQIVNYNDHGNVHKIFDYIINHAEDRNTKFVWGLGDTTDKDSGAEWELAKQQFHRLDDVTNWNIVRGNHDSEFGFNKYFKPSDMVGNYTGCYQDSCRDMYQTLFIGDLKYLMVSLDMGPSDSELEWANEIIDIYSDYNVIITTHAYLEANSMIRENENSNVRATRYGGFNNGCDMWEKCFKKHENIVGIICGHEDTDGPKYNVVYGEKGNKIYEFIIDPQGLDADASIGSTGMVNTFYVSKDGKQVFVDNFSTIKNKYYLEDYQFSFEPNVIAATDPVHTYGEWRNVEEATSEHVGHDIRECKICGHCDVREVVYEGGEN